MRKVSLMIVFGIFIVTFVPDLSEAESYLLFPGQIVVVEGHNATGQTLVAKTIYTVY
jgi:hypothetical protein